MQGAHLGIARSTLPMLLPVAVGKTRGVQEDFASSWAQATKASAGELQKARVVFVRNDAVAETAKKPDAAADVEETVDAAPQLTAAQVTKAVVSTPVALQAATHDVVAAETPKKTLGAEDKDAVSETKKPKAVKDQGIDGDGKDTPQIDVTVTVTNMDLPTAPLFVVPVVPPPVGLVAKSDSEGVAKVDVATSKRPAIVAKSNGVAKSIGDEAKPAAGVDAGTTSNAEMKGKTIEVAPAPVAAHAAGAAGTSGLSGGVAQAALEPAAPMLTHKPETATVVAAMDVQRNLPATAADANVVQALPAGPGQLEVGVLDGTHGWLKIRAEMGTDGSVTAQLTSSATAHEGLRETVPAMTGYLESESLNVSNIAVHRAAESSAAGTDLANAGGGSAGGDQEKGQAHQGGRNLQPWTNSRAEIEQEAEATMSGISAVVFGGGMGFSGNGLGSWLSVTA